jgi:translation initiation factor IF-2
VSVPADPVEVGRPAAPPVEPAVDEPLEPAVDEPRAAPVDEPLTAPVDEPLTAPADEPVAAPVDEPVAAGAEPACACALVRLDVVVVVCLELPHAASVIDSTTGKSFQGLTISA